MYIYIFIYNIHYTGTMWNERRLTTIEIYVNKWDRPIENIYITLCGCVISTNVCRLLCFSSFQVFCNFFSCFFLVIFFLSYFYFRFCEVDKRVRAGGDMCSFLS